MGVGRVSVWVCMHGCVSGCWVSECMVCIHIFVSEYEDGHDQ